VEFVPHIIDGQEVEALDGGGVLNVVHGYGYGYGPDSAGSALTEDPRVDRITFTGESGTGKIIARAAASNLAPVSLELGGKGANVVFDDADLDDGVAWSITAILTNAGQVCLAGSRLYVHRGSSMSSSRSYPHDGEPQVESARFRCRPRRRRLYDELPPGRRPPRQVAPNSGAVLRRSRPSEHDRPSRA
jgi:hypothetical protein